MYGRLTNEQIKMCVSMCCMDVWMMMSVCVVCAVYKCFVLILARCSFACFGRNGNTSKMSKREALEAFLADEEESKQDPEEHFELSEKLGEGSYGNVFKGIHKDSNHEVAVKIIPVQGGWEELKKEIKIY